MDNKDGFYRGKRKNYHWPDFQRQNEMMLSLLRNSTLEYDVIHAYHANILRPDGKDGDADCLHNCEMNGKMEFYNDNLLHILVQHYGGGEGRRRRKNDDVVK